MTPKVDPDKVLDLKGSFRGAKEDPGFLKQWDLDEMCSDTVGSQASKLDALLADFCRF